jgi:hypothetical protein
MQIWTPGAAGPLDEFVARVTRMVSAFARDQGIERAEVCVELMDGSRHLLAEATAEPGFGFFSFTPHAGASDAGEGEEPKRVVVPIGAVKLIEISLPDPERAFGFAADD